MTRKPDEALNSLKKEMNDQLKDGPITLTLEGPRRKQVEDIEPD
jgi:hypothetical protein